MQKETGAESEPTLSQKIHAVVDKMLAPYGKTSPRGMGLLAFDSPPIDISKPNQHNSKAEFSLEFEAVNQSANAVREIVRNLAASDDSPEHLEMLQRLEPVINEKFAAMAPRTLVNDPVELVRKNVADVGGFTATLFILLDFWMVLQERQAELRDQEAEFWSVPHRAPDYHARAVALRLAKLFAKETCQRPTTGTSGETGEPSTGYARALSEIFDLLDISTGVRSPAEWAVGQISEEDFRPPTNHLATLLGNTDQQSKPSESTRKIVDALMKRSEQ